MPRQRSRDCAKDLTLVEIMDAVQNSKINAMYLQDENQAMSDPDQVHARKALAGLDHLVVQDIFLPEMAWFAGVILPGPRMDLGKRSSSVRALRPKVARPNCCLLILFRRMTCPMRISRWYRRWAVYSKTGILM
ncbi:MAG: molybdopterin-dependent oxidoreductase [Pseudomonadota bacterium]